MRFRSPASVALSIEAFGRAIGLVRSAAFTWVKAPTTILHPEPEMVRPERFLKLLAPVGTPKRCSHDPLDGTR
ncbi:MAG TPA: hypothetical protein VE093_14685 [Polyangiaceae bacterium]|nr:hypothetical protein [Polyangiaceae bacterium]